MDIPITDWQLYFQPTFLEQEKNEVYFPSIVQYFDQFDNTEIADWIASQATLFEYHLHKIKEKSEKTVNMIRLFAAKGVSSAISISIRGNEDLMDSCLKQF